MPHCSASPSVAQTIAKRYSLVFKVIMKLCVSSRSPIYRYRGLDAALVTPSDPLRHMYSHG